ncbi:MAG: phage tail protein [Burkholderiaceae bacterium]
MGGSTISTSETRIEAFKLQSSCYGATVALLYGMPRASGNLVWYGGFKGIAHTTVQAQGGKGGGVSTENTTYTYTASVMMGLCHGLITGIPRVWKGSKLFKGGYTPAQILTATETFTIGAVPYVRATGHAATFAATVSVTANFGSGESFGIVGLVEGTDYTLVNGVYTFLKYAGLDVTLVYQYLTGAYTQDALQSLGLSFISGALGQAPWAPLATLAPAQSIGYSGMALVAGQDYDLGTGAQIENHVFEVQAAMAWSVSSTTPDADPADFTLDALTNERYGAAFPAGRMGDVTAWGNYNRASGLLCSPAITEQTRAADMVAMSCRLTNTGAVWSGSKLKFVPYGDQALSGNGRTYTPNTTPLYDLTDDHFLDEDDPVKVTAKAPSDRYNHIRVEYRNRGTFDVPTQLFQGQHSIEIAEAKDQADIDANGLRSADVEQMHWICDGAVARTVAQLLLQRSLYITNTYSFRLPVNFSLVEPMDLLTITDPDQGLNLTPVRVITRDEDEDGELAFTCEDFPLGVASATLYPSQLGTGFAHDYNVAPGNVDAPVFFEAPVERTVTGLEVYAAVRGSAAAWGGCRVWVSLDGTNYKQIATIYGGARYGALTGPVSGGNLPVSVAGQLISGSAADAAALNTLCWVGGVSPEYFAYTTASLTGPGAYTLGGLVRGAYSTSAASAHATSDKFVRVDDAIAKSGPLDLAMIGKTIQFKFTSFNLYSAAEQGLADVSAYSYPISGNMVALPPSQPTGATYALEPFGIRLSCNKNPEPDVVGYEWRVGATWVSAQVLDKLGGTSYLWVVQNGGAFTAWVAAIDALGNASTPVSLAGSVPTPTISSLSSALSGTDMALQWVGVPGSFAIAGYEVRYGATWAAATVIEFRQTSTYTETVRWGGSRLYWVAAIDVKGNYGTPVSLNVTVNVPGIVTGTRSEIIDNDALLYWTAPAIGAGQLAIDRYEVRKGASFAGGTVVGSNGNSTFTAIFEQASGTYTYWVAPVDSAGNFGTAVGIVATINQPPDYVLRNNYDSALGGTLVNFYLASGAILGPVDTTKTWATHFTSNSWATPADQITAGFPIYADPSVTSGSYEEVIDYGASIPPTVVTATLNSTLITGAVTVACTMSWKLNIGDAWTVLPAGTSSALIPQFRYVRVHYDFTCTAGANLIQINGLNVKLAIKLRNDSGAGTASVGGTAVTFGYAFVAADTPIVQPNGATPLIPVVIYSGGANPTGFTVKLYNLSGTDVGGSFSWTVRGY